MSRSSGGLASSSRAVFARRAVGSAFALAVLGQVVGCAGTPTPLVLPVVAAPAVAAPPPRPAVAIRAGAMPADVDLYAELTEVPRLLAAARASLGAGAADELAAALARELGLEVPQASALLGAIDSIHVGSRRAAESAGGGRGARFDAALTLVLTDAAPVRAMLASGVLAEDASVGAHGKRLQARGHKGSLLWFEGSRLLALGDAPMLSVITAVVEGPNDEIGDDARHVATRHGAPFFAFVAPTVLDEASAGALTFPAPVTVTYDLFRGALRGALRATLAGPQAAGLTPIPPRALAIAKRLPAETLGYVALATGAEGQPGLATKLVTRLASAIGGAGEIGGADPAIAGLDRVQILDALGGEGVAAIAVRAGTPASSWAASGALLVVQDFADAKAAARAVELVRKKLADKREKKTKVAVEAGGFEVTSSDTLAPYARVRLAKGTLFVGLGQRDVVERALAALDTGKGTLGEDGAHTRSLEGVPPASGLRLWVDAARLASLVADNFAPADRRFFEATQGPFTGADRPATTFALSAIPDGPALRIELDQTGSLGVLAALSFYGVRRYLHNAKTAEARNTLGAITRAAVAAYERESMGGAGGQVVTHKLCASAPAVPSAVPRGTKYASQSSEWQRGDDLTGWRCLRFEMSSPQYFRYAYVAGGPYLGPARGGPDPGPDGFEVSAEGDLDGNGKTSLFTRVGRVDPGTGSIRITPEIFVDHEEE